MGKVYKSRATSNTVPTSVKRLQAKIILGIQHALLAEDDNHEQHNRSRNSNGNDQAGPRSHHANHARLKPRCSECARNQQGGRKHHAEHSKRLAPPRIARRLCNHGDQPTNDSAPGSRCRKHGQQAMRDIDLREIPVKERLPSHHVAGSAGAQNQRPQRRIRKRDESVARAKARARCQREERVEAEGAHQRQRHGNVRLGNSHAADEEPPRNACRQQNDAN